MGFYSAKKAACCSFLHMFSSGDIFWKTAKCDHVWCYVTPLMDRLSLEPLINPCSMACSSPVTITPCACCHPAVLCLQSYSVHLSGTIYGKQFVVYHGTCSSLRTFYSVFLYLLHIIHGCFSCTHFWPSVRIDYLQVLWFLFPDKVEGLQASPLGF